MDGREGRLFENGVGLLEVSRYISETRMYGVLHELRGGVLSDTITTEVRLVDAFSPAIQRDFFFRQAMAEKIRQACFETFLELTIVEAV